MNFVMSILYRGEGLYGGCLSDDVNTLRFTYFDVQGVLGLRCSHVNVLYLNGI